jgi:ribosomal-protein-alanine N-acetyltransferase
MAEEQHKHLRQLSPRDRNLIGSFLTHAEHKHFHLDWFGIYEILGEQPFLALISEGKPQALLACPPDPPRVAWIRLFAVHTAQHEAETWNELWNAARKAAIALGAESAAALSTRSWFDQILLGSSFEQANEVLFLEWTEGEAETDLHQANELGIRTMREQDLPQVTAVDQAAFDPVWSLSLRSLTAAFSLASLATVLEVEGRIIAYQISTASALGAHLARLAVLPGEQGHGYGRALVQHVLRIHVRRGLGCVSVNTQADNLHSQQLYQSLGFKETGQRYPLFQDTF